MGLNIYVLVRLSFHIRLNTYISFRSKLLKILLIFFYS